MTRKKIKQKVLIGLYLFLATTNSIYADTTTQSNITQVLQPQPTTIAKQQPSSVSILQPTLPTSNQQIYTIELQVTGEDETERKQSFTKALEQILTKNQGNQITNLPIIKTALSNPDIYVQRYTYINRSNLIGSSSLFLQIQFDQESITQLLQQIPAIQTPSADNKAKTLVWLAKVVTPGNTVIENEKSNDAIIPVLKKNAQDFGIQIILPMSDLQNMNQIKADDICNLNTLAIKNASQRYGTNTIIAGCIKQPVMGDIMWRSQWLLLRDNRNDILSFSGATAENIITQAMRTITPNIVSLENKPPNPTKKVIMRITNVKGLEQYNEVVRYLNQITPIDLVKLGTTEVELSFNSGEQQKLLAALATQNKLIRNADTTNLPSGIDLDYKWVTTNNEQTTAAGIKPVP